MDAAKKIILLLALVVACALPASALTPSAPENRVWEKITGTLETHQEASPQVPQSHQEEAGATAETVSECFLAAEGAAPAINEGTQLFRVFGNEAKGLGNYYTTVNPGTVSDFRTAAGLFPGNSGQFVLEGTLNDTEGVIFREAAPGPGGVGGGLPEVYVPNPGSQINITNVSGVNPEF